MTYNNLLSKLPTDSELHYLSDTDSEYHNENYNYILFEYTTDWFPTLASLKSNNIEFIIKKDSFDLEYILIK